MPDDSENDRLTTVQLKSQPVVVPRLELVVEREDGRPTLRTLELEGELIRVGSHPNNEVSLADRQVSRFHCTLTRTAEGWTLVDVGSRNGTFISGVRVRNADLPLPSCRLELGGSLVRVRELRPKSVTEVPLASSFGELVGQSLVMRRLFARLQKVAQSESTVLIEGESGTGKELVATELVQQGARADKPFLVVDCGAISRPLLESELFGHVRGAFTGADRTRIGAFEAANGGTIFLDEIGELPLEVQPKLLRALEAREIRRMGENVPRRLDVRVIAATNRNLMLEVNQARFREDLYFRLSVVSVRLPPLRQRLDDLPLLIGVLLRSMNAEDREGLFTPEVVADMQRHDWPGNVRELRNYIERAVVLERTGAPRGSNLPPPSAHAGEPSADESLVDLPFKVAKDQVIAEFELRYLKRLMELAEGNVSRAAREAKMDRMYLHRLLQRYELAGKPRA